MKQSIADQLTEYYCFIDDFLKTHPTMANWRRSNHNAPRFSDAEVLTIALMQAYFGCATLEQTYLSVMANAGSAFPHACAYKQWIARALSLTTLVGRLIPATLQPEALTFQLFLMDSKPIQLCHPLRHGRARSMRQDGAWFGKTKKGWFFGFKSHAVVTRDGLVLGTILTPGNVNDRDPAPALTEVMAGGVGLADLGYRGGALQTQLWEDGEVLLPTPADANTGQAKALISSLRERIETTFSQLWSLFVDRVYSRSWNGLWTTIKLKTLHFNLASAGLISA
jgi:transposase